MITPEGLDPTKFALEVIAVSEDVVRAREMDWRMRCRSRRGDEVTLPVNKVGIGDLGLLPDAQVSYLVVPTKVENGGQAINVLVRAPKEGVVEVQVHDREQGGWQDVTDPREKAVLMSRAWDSTGMADMDKRILMIAEERLRKVGRIGRR
jgi:hypothetical protein